MEYNRGDISTLYRTVNLICDPKETAEAETAKALLLLIRKIYIEFNEENIFRTSLVKPYYIKLLHLIGDAGGGGGGPPTSKPKMISA